MSRQNTGFIALRIMGTSMAGRLSQRDAGFFAHTRSAIPENITATTRGAEIAQRADVSLFMPRDTPDVGRERFDQTRMVEQLSQLEIRRQSSA